MEITLSTLEKRHRVATCIDGEVEHQGNFERPIVLLNLMTQFVQPLVAFIIPQFSLVSVEAEHFLLGFTRGNHTPTRAHIREKDGQHLFELQDSGGWRSPFPDGGPAMLYILR